MQDNPTLIFNIAGSSDDLLQKLFPEDSRGGVLFGPTANSAATRADLGNWASFRDYLMEGFITYDLRMLSDDSGVVIQVRPSGSNRDKYLRSHIRWILRSAQLSFREEARRMR